MIIYYYCARADGENGGRRGIEAVSAWKMHDLARLLVPGPIVERLCLSFACHANCNASLDEIVIGAVQLRGCHARKNFPFSPDPQTNSVSLHPPLPTLFEWHFAAEKTSSAFRQTRDRRSVLDDSSAQR